MNTFEPALRAPQLSADRATPAAPATQTASSMTMGSVPYHRTLASGRRRIWRGIIALVLLIAGMLAMGMVTGFIAITIETALGRGEEIANGQITPLMLAALMVSLALLTPWSMLLQRWLYRVPVRMMHSVRGVLRFELIGRAIIIAVPAWALSMALLSLPGLPGFQEGMWTTGDLIACMVITLVLVPLQAAGEEYGFRGLAMRIGASWGAGPRSGLVIGLTISSLLFMVAHGALDPWLNLYYFVFGLSLGVIAWRSGGLEIPIVLHAVNNVVSFLYSLLLRADMAAGFDRSAGMGSAAMLLPCAMIAGSAAVVWLCTLRGTRTASALEAARE